MTGRDVIENLTISENEEKNISLLDAEDNIVSLLSPEEAGVQEEVAAPSGPLVAALTRAQAKKEAAGAEGVPSLEKMLPGVTIQSSENWQNEVILKQEKNPEISKIRLILGEKRKRKKNYKMMDGIVYRKERTGKFLIYIPSSLRVKVLENCHDSILGGHYALDKTLDLVKTVYWWPSMRNFVSHFVESCVKCQTFKPNLKKLGLLQPISSQRPFQKMACDFVELTRSSRGNCNCFVLVDLYSGFVYAVPTRQLRTVDAIKALSSLLPYVAVPEILMCDEGPEFTSKEFQDYVQKIGIKKLNVVPPAAHFSNGKAEAAIKKINNIMRNYLEDGRADWDEELPILLNTIISVKAPSSSLKKKKGTENIEEIRKSIREDVDRKKERKQAAQKRQYDKNRAHQEFEVGDKALVYFELKTQLGLPAKLQRKFRAGVVVEKDTPNTYKLRLHGQGVEGKVRRAHTALMKRFVDRRQPE
ncbi:Pro-Pol polyprotein [Frankliniella fusca]|uniref:RNA-directed DNA polymerase n=1 Tax=Frankliniella fusca TaxID=407009 RepID=A0AAE1GVD0_9NEOP|nr:Pro-Pol polyprotein [Frankliniella fusca]